MTTSPDPVLAKLIADVSEAEAVIPLTLHLPSGVLSGMTATSRDFRERANDRLGRWLKSHLAIEPNGEDGQYVHLNLGEVDSGTVVRVDLAAVVGWSVALIAPRPEP